MGANVEREAAAILRSILKAIESGELEATTPRAVALVRRIEGAATALEQAGKQRRSGTKDADFD